MDEKSCVTFLLLCDPGWYVHKPDVQNKWVENTHKHTHGDQSRSWPAEQGENEKRKDHYSKVVIKMKKLKNVTDYNQPVTPPVDANCVKLTKGLETDKALLLRQRGVGGKLSKG